MGTPYARQTEDQKRRGRERHAAWYHSEEGHAQATVYFADRKAKRRINKWTAGLPAEFVPVALEVARLKSKLGAVWTPGQPARVADYLEEHFDEIVRRAHTLQRQREYSKVWVRRPEVRARRAAYMRAYRKGPPTPSCQWCGTDLPPSRADRKYCGVNHRVAAHRSKHRSGGT